jgi:SpoU rRNA methylase family enzyme
MESYAQSKPDTIKTVNPAAYWYNGELVTFEYMRDEIEVVDSDKITPLYEKQLIEKVEPVSDAIKAKIVEIKTSKASIQGQYLACIDESEKDIMANLNTEKSIQIRDLEDLLKISKGNPIKGQ